MAYDENLALHIQILLSRETGLVEKKMFGGVGFILNGNMACGVHKDSLIVRVGVDAYQSALDQTHVRPFDMTGRPMTGWVMVEPAGFVHDEALKAWVMQGMEFARSLPPK